MNDLNLKPVKKEKDIDILLNDEKIPSELVGKFYLRNGGNPYIKNDKNHIFDGDGMIHVIYFKQNKIEYHNRWIKTFRLKLEKKYNKQMFVRLGNLTSIEIFKNFMSRLISFEDTFLNNGEGTANTNIIYHANKLLALNEMDKPYLLDIINNKLITIKRYDFDEKLKHNFNAHPKIDPDTQEMIGLGYDILRQMCYISFIDKNGKLNKEIEIKISGQRLIHDLGITKNKVIILDLPLEFSLTNIIMSNFPIHINKNGISKIGILDRNLYNIEWYKLENNEIIFHIANSWEIKNGKYIIIYAFCYDVNNLDIKKLESQRPLLKKFTINTHNKKVKIEIVSNIYGELPVIEDNLTGKECDFIYYSKICNNGFDGIVKHNTKTKEQNIIEFPKNMYGGECAIYDNYIINILYDITDKKSKLAIYDKNTLKLNNLIDLNCRIPFGFHGKIVKFD
jgi:carotenoid cleavage dioxygenase